MSDSDLQSVNRRLNMEKQYADLTKKTGKGKKIVKKIIAVAGTLSAAEGAYKTYKKLADKAIDSIGDMVINDLNKRILKLQSKENVYGTLKHCRSQVLRHVSRCRNERRNTSLQRNRNGDAAHRRSYCQSWHLL